MKPVTIHKIIVKNGAYEVLWETYLIGDFYLGDVYSAIAQANLCELGKDTVVYIIRACGLPEAGEDVSYKKVAGTVIGMVHVKKKKGWQCESQ